MWLQVKFPLWLKYFLIGFAHIFVSFAAFALPFLFNSQQAPWIFLLLPILFNIAVFIGGTYLLLRIANKHNSHKWLWMVMVGFLFSFAWVFFEGSIGFGIILYVYELVDNLIGSAGGYWMLWFFWWLPVAALLTIVESSTAYYFIKCKQLKSE